MKDFKTKENVKPGPGSVCGGLWITGLQDKLVRTMAAMISSISTDSGLRKLDGEETNPFSFGLDTSDAKLLPAASLTCSELLPFLPRRQRARKTQHCEREQPGLLLCSCDGSSPPGHIFGLAPSERGKSLVSL